LYSAGLCDPNHDELMRIGGGVLGGGTILSLGSEDLVGAGRRRFGSLPRSSGYRARRGEKKILFS